ncbi:MAG: hypothetical protein HC770_11425 [Pseudanabaena sp. CRU_2_10]|nr:hypothetical protein [Pseudanabaena sp. CRU_2_10]
MIQEQAEQYLTDADGNKIAVVIDIATYQKMLDDLDELYCLKGYEQAVVETDPEIASGDYTTLDQYLNSRMSNQQ